MMWTIAPFGATIPYYFTGHEGPDSVCIDSDDNLYVAVWTRACSSLQQTWLSYWSNLNARA